MQLQHITPALIKAHELVKENKLRLVAARVVPVFM